MKKILFIVIIFLAVFLRLYNLGVGDLDTDEAKTAWALTTAVMLSCRAGCLFSDFIWSNEFFPLVCR
jgi:hypothetical protein